MNAGISRRTMIKGMAAMGGAAGLAMMTGCSFGSSKGEGASSSSAIYSGVAKGMRGDVTAYVSFDGKEITGILVDAPDDSPVIKDAAIESVVERVIAQQNIEVDAVSGATMTSMGILGAVTDALESAGADIKAFKKGSDAPTKAERETESCDILVIGSGMAGMSAAMQVALHSDKKVIVLEKQAYPGGSTRVCGGGIWTVGGLANEIIGQDSTKEEYISFMQGRSGAAELNTDLMGNIYDISGEAFSDLFNWGLPVSLNSWNLGHPDSKLPCIDSTANINCDWETGNSGLADFLAKIAAANGVDVRLNSKVTDLVVEDGSIVGANVEDLESTYRIDAKKTIIATGGFTRNADLVAKYAPDYTSAFPFTGSGGTGDGHVMAEKLGAPIIGSGMMGLSGINPSLGYYGPIGGAVWAAQMTVNAEGERFMDKKFYGDTLALLVEQTNSCGYGIYDASNEIVDRLEAGVEAGVVAKYDNLDDLASGQGIDADALKKQAESADIKLAPFYCIQRKPLFIGSIPGIKVDEHCRVVNESSEEIGNLYAAGEVMYANVFDGTYPASGSGVGTSCYTGAISARDALAALA